MTANTAALPVAPAGKFLSFRLGVDEYGVEILKVQEILGGTGVTRAPRTEEPVRGWVDVRGRRVPVVDVRACLHLPRAAASGTGSIIVADIAREGGTLAVGLLVDEVCEVLTLHEGEIHAPPLGGGGMEETDLIHGLGRLRDRDVVLVDVDRLLNTEDLTILDGLAG